MEWIEWEVPWNKKKSPCNFPNEIKFANQFLQCTHVQDETEKWQWFEKKGRVELGDCYSLVLLYQWSFLACHNRPQRSGQPMANPLAPVLHMPGNWREQMLPSPFYICQYNSYYSFISDIIMLKHFFFIHWWIVNWTHHTDILELTYYGRFYYLLLAYSARYQSSAQSSIKTKTKTHH